MGDLGDRKSKFGVFWGISVDSIAVQAGTGRVFFTSGRVRVG